MVSPAGRKRQDAIDTSPSRSTTELTRINSVILHFLKKELHRCKERQGKSYETLELAYRSLKICPVGFTNVETLEQLYGFESRALRKELHRLLLGWCAENGKHLVDVPENAVAGPSNSSPEPASKKGSKAKGTATAERPASKAKKGKEPKVYVPQFRTGGHGILVALLCLTPELTAEEQQARDADIGAPIDDTHYHAKASITAVGQPFSDSQYAPKETPSHFSRGTVSFHTAWSSIKTLINRGYVYRRGNPARFGLSAVGWQVARTCAEQEKGVTPGCKVGFQVDADDETQRAGRKGKKKTSGKGNMSGEAITAVPFAYAYLTDTVPPRCVTSRTESRMRLSDVDYCLRYRITFPASQSGHAFAVSCVEDAEPDARSPSSMITGWVKESVCNADAPGLPVEPPEETQPPLDEAIAVQEAVSVVPSVSKKVARKRTTEPAQADAGAGTKAKKARTTVRRSKVHADPPSRDFLDTTDEEAGDSSRPPPSTMKKRTAAAPLSKLDNGQVTQRRASGEGGKPAKTVRRKAQFDPPSRDLLDTSDEEDDSSLPPSLPTKRKSVDVAPLSIRDAGQIARRTESGEGSKRVAAATETVVLLSSSSSDTEPIIRKRQFSKRSPSSLPKWSAKSSAKETLCISSDADSIILDVRPPMSPTQQVRRVQQGSNIVR